MISIVIMAHNEESDIARSVDSVLAQNSFTHEDRITVMENGSTDRTAEIVQGIASRHPNVTLCSVELGDKANAWSYYIFNASQGIAADAHVFLDGDVMMRPGSLASIRKTFIEFPDALAVSGLPYGGRTAVAWRARVLREHGMPGNFYALRDSTIDAMRSDRWCLPVGYMGDDTFLQWILKRRLDPMSKPDKSAIQPAPDAGFEYQSIPKNTLSGLSQLYRRQRAYAMRDIQSKLLSDHLLAGPGHRPPLDISELYSQARPWTALFGPFGSLKPFKMRKLLFLNTYFRTRSVSARKAAPWYEFETDISNTDATLQRN